MKDSSHQGRNRRSVRNLLLYPGAQLRVLFAVPAAGLIAMLVILHVLKNAVGERLTTYIASPIHNLETINELYFKINGIFNIGIVFLALCSVLVTVFGLIITHRYYGPLIPILRALRAFRDGDYSARVHLRPGDELRDVARVINEIGEKNAPRNTP